MNHDSQTLQWQPIETAPKGVPVLVWAKEWGEPFSAYVAKLDEYGWDVCGVSGYEWETSFVDTPTHWMPLPEGPK